MQKPKIILTNPEAARALRDNELLAQFLEPKSPSEVAKETGQPANLVHHHAKRFLELGLLFEASRKAGKVFYQLTAREFKFDYHLLGEETNAADLNELTTAFVQAYERSNALEGREPDYSSHSFHDRSEMPHGNQALLIRKSLESKKPREILEPHPAHYGFRTFTLSAARYQELVKKITMLMIECEDEPNSSDGLCTIALLGFHGAIREGGTASAALNSFVQI